MPEDIDGPVIAQLAERYRGPGANSQPVVRRSNKDPALVTLRAVRDDLSELLDGAVDAPNVWRWTVQRAFARIDAYLTLLGDLEQHSPDDPVQKVNPE